jgi:Rv2525c-like, glycoside hydrolase-like domain
MAKPSRAILALVALISGLTVAGSTLTASASARVIGYHGREVSVPPGWAVYDLARHPSLCVRLDLHAVYLGTPSSTQRCPAHVVGRSRAIVVEPSSGGATVLHGPRAAQPSGGGSPTGGGSPNGSGSPSGGQGPGTVGPVGPQAGAIFSGLGFDPCAAPSQTQMAAWLSSPYRAVGVYVGGPNMACAQPNLTAGWVSQESAAGWHLIPTYVGLQAPNNSCGCAGINPGAASAQGVAEASDAIAHTARLGLGPGNPIYTDMEYYPRGANSGAVLAFLSGWTKRLHAAGYLSGVYGNSDSVIADLLTREGTKYPEPDDIWFAEWNDAQNVTSSYIPSGFWIGHRLHQYSGGQNATYGGVTINIDGDAMDGATGAAGSSLRAQLPQFPDGTFVEVSGQQTVYRIAGGAPLAVNDWTAFGGPQPFQVISKRQFDRLNRVPANGTFLKAVWGSPYPVTSNYRVAGGAAMPITSTAAFPASSSAITIDQWDILHARNPLAHLAVRPADGTIVEGLPSLTYWVFQGGMRQTIPATSAATQVDDHALDPYPMVPCLVPALGGLTLAQARTVALAADCTVGTIRRLRTPGPHQYLHVVKQYPGPGSTREALKPITLTLD